MRFSPLLLLPLLPVSLAHAAPDTTAKPPVASSKTVKKLTPAQLKEQKVDALWKESDVKFHHGDYAGAVAIHRKIVALDPSDVESYSVASWLLWSLGKGPDALAFIQQGLVANPKDPEMWDAAGQQYNLQKRAPQAETAFGRAVALSGKKADMLLRRRYAHAAREAGHLNKSAEIWRALVADYPNDAVNKNNLERVKKAAQPKGGTSV